MNIIAVIPAHLASVRFPNKVLHNFYGLPMIEHVRRRALLSTVIKEVYVATCDTQIAETIKQFGGKVLLTSNNHKNGTTRVAEAIKDIDCSHVILLQGDEPLLLPRHIDKVALEINKSPLMVCKVSVFVDVFSLPIHWILYCSDLDTKKAILF